MNHNSEMGRLTVGIYLLERWLKLLTGFSFDGVHTAVFELTVWIIKNKFIGIDLCKIIWFEGKLSILYENKNAQSFLHIEKTTSVKPFDFAAV